MWLKGYQTAQHPTLEIILDVHRGNVHLQSIEFGLVWGTGDVS